MVETLAAAVTSMGQQEHYQQQRTQNWRSTGALCMYAYNICGIPRAKPERPCIVIPNSSQCLPTCIQRHNGRLQVAKKSIFEKSLLSWKTNIITGEKCYAQTSAYSPVPHAMLPPPLLKRAGEQIHVFHLGLQICFMHTVWQKYQQIITVKQNGVYSASQSCWIIWLLSTTEQARGGGDIRVLYH